MSGVEADSYCIKRRTYLSGQIPTPNSIHPPFKGCLASRLHMTEDGSQGLGKCGAPAEYRGPATTLHSCCTPWGMHQTAGGVAWASPGAGKMALPSPPPLEVGTCLALLPSCWPLTPEQLGWERQDCRSFCELSPARNRE